MTVAVALLVIFFIGSAVCAIAAGGIPAFAGTIRQKEVLFALRLSAATASLSTYCDGPGTSHRICPDPDLHAL